MKKSAEPVVELVLAVALMALAAFIIVPERKASLPFVSSALGTSMQSPPAASVEDIILAAPGKIAVLFSRHQPVTEGSVTANTAAPRAPSEPGGSEPEEAVTIEPEPTPKPRMTSREPASAEAASVEPELRPKTAPSGETTSVLTQPTIDITETPEEPAQEAPNTPDTTQDLAFLGAVERNDGITRYIFRVKKTNQVLTLSPGETKLGWTLAEVREGRFVFEYGRKRYLVSSE